MTNLDSEHLQSPATKHPWFEQRQTIDPFTNHGSQNRESTDIFTILPNIGTESLLCHASENLASLSVMATNLAGEMEGSYRNVTLAIQQLIVLSELLVNRALDNLDPP
ncbi:DUF6124 family protein [Pseudomonas sp. Eth.TT006]